MTANPPENGPEPADLSQLAATDALLDRLGGREPADDDLDDAAVAALFQLVAFVDESREPDLGLARVVEVLDGRPLYVTGPEEASESSRIELDGVPVTVASASASADETATVVIDLTDHHRADSLSPVAVLDDVPVPADADEPAGELVAVRSIRSAAGAKKADAAVAATHRWERALHNAALPAAAVIALFVLGSGVSAAVTGDPMTPVNGVSRVMAQLPGGGDDSQHRVSQVRGEISAADKAVRRHDQPSASRHLANARKALAGVPAASKAGLQLAIANVESALDGPLVAPVVQATAPAVIQAGGGPTAAPTGSSGGSSTTGTPPVGVTSQPAGGVPVTSTPASATTTTTTAPPPTAAPTTTPAAAPSAAPTTTPAGVRSTQAVPIQPSTAPTTSGS